MGGTIRVGLDIGITNTKAVACDAAGAVLKMSRYESEDPEASAEAVATRVAQACGCEPGDIAEISLTGVKARRFEGKVLGRPTRTVNEFAAIGTGGLALTGRERAVVASIGTGTVFVFAEGREFRHLGGSGVGGGTLSGMCRHLFGLDRYADIVKAAESGDIFKVDLKVGDVIDDAYITLARDLTCSNFGKIGKGGPVGTGDFVLGIMNMILETVGVMAKLACKGAGLDEGPVAVVGALAELPPAPAVFSTFHRRMGVEYVIADKPLYATAIGAVLH